MTQITLRPYQQECLDAIAAQKSGSHLIHLPTGAGKTVIFSHIPRRGRVLLISHRDELVRQPIKYYDCPVGIEQAGSHEHGEEVVSASVQSLTRRVDRFDPEAFDSIIVDECFPAGTLVDGVPIERLKIGDIVKSYNEITKEVELKRITHIFRNPARHLVRVKLDGKEIVCTAAHPIRTKSGYVPAAGLKNGDEVLCLREADHSAEQKSEGAGSPRSSLLLGRMPIGILSEDFQRDNAPNEPEAAGNHFSADEVAQPDGDLGYTREDERNASPNRSQASDPRRERARDDDPPANANGSSSRIFAGTGICGEDSREEDQLASHPDFVQNRHSNPAGNAGDRDRWGIPQESRAAGSGSKEGNGIDLLRVDGVEVLEQGSDGRYGGLCANGIVYNFEVEDNHNYFVKGVLVHNCHHSSSDSYQRILRHFHNRLTLGFTATPNRADGKGLGDIFEDIIFSRDLRWMIQQGYLSDIRCLRVNIGYDLSKVHVRGGDYAPGELEEAMDGTETAIAQAYREHAKGATLIFAASVAHAERIAEQIPGAAVITGKTPNRTEILQAFTRREIPVIVNCMVLTEGTDLPLVETVIIARPTRSQPLYCQMVGRGLRLSPGKEFLTLIDCTGATKNNDICTAPSLIGVDISEVAPERRQNIQGRLFDLDDIAKAEKDVPETWIRSIELVDLWAKNVGYNTHGVNWTRNPDGSMVVTLTDFNEVYIPAPDSLGYTTMPGIGRMPMQAALDEAYLILCRDFDYCRAIWDTSVIKRWGDDAATEKQIAIIRRSKLTKGWQIPEELTKGQAAQVINHIFARKRGGR